MPTVRGPDGEDDRTVSRRYAYVRQEDHSDCGAAALAAIALHHGIPIGLQQMRELAGTDRDGTNLLGLVQAAERLGFSARAVKGPYEALSTVPPARGGPRPDRGGAGALRGPLPRGERFYRRGRPG